METAIKTAKKMGYTFNEAEMDVLDKEITSMKENVKNKSKEDIAQDIKKRYKQVRSDLKDAGVKVNKPKNGSQ